MNNVEELIYTSGIMPVIKIDRAQDAVPLCRALADGGLALAEITLRTSAAIEAIARVTAELPVMTVGAGTVTCIEQAQAALKAGALFLVSPGFNPEVVKWCVNNNVLIYPGCTTASEVEAAMNLGLRIVKFFPAEQSGGLEKIKALCGPYPAMYFMPTGGINLKNMADYLLSPRIFACGGSFMVKDDLVSGGYWVEISALARQAVAVAHGFELVSVGLYFDSAAQAIEAADELAGLTGHKIQDGQSVVSVGSGVELVKSSGLGKGYLTYGVLNVDRSVGYLKRRGFEPDEGTIRRDSEGRIMFASLKRSIGGFGVHLQPQPQQHR